MQQGDQALAVWMQEADIARPSEPLGQHMLQYQPEEIRATHSSTRKLPGFAIAVTETHLTVRAGDDVVLADDPAIQIATQGVPCS